MADQPESETEKIKVSFSLKSETRRALRIAAAEDGREMSDIVEECLTHYFEARERKKARGK